MKVKEKNKKTEENRRHGEKSRVEGVPEEGRERDENQEEEEEGTAMCDAPCDAR